MRKVEEWLSALRRSFELGRIVELLHMGLERLKGSCWCSNDKKISVITGQSVQLSSERSFEGSTVSAAAKSAKQHFINSTKITPTGDVLVSSERGSDLGLVREFNSVLRGGRE